MIVRHRLRRPEGASERKSNTNPKMTLPSVESFVGKEQAKTSVADR